MSPSGGKRKLGESRGRLLDMAEALTAYRACDCCYPRRRIGWDWAALTGEMEPAGWSVIHTIMSKIATALALPCLLAACTAAGSQRSQAVASPQTVPPPTIPPPAPCPIASSSDWRAWVDAKGWPDRPATLHVAGRATLPWGGWQIYWKNMQVLQSTPPHVYVELDAKPPSVGGQQPDAQSVTGSWPSEAVIGSVTIVCRNTQLARISTVETVR